MDRGRYSRESMGEWIGNQEEIVQSFVVLSLGFTR